MKKHLKHAKPDAAINDEVQPAPAGPQPTTTDAAPTGEPPTAAQPQEAAPPDQTHTTPPQEQIPAEELKALRERAAKADEYWDRLLRTAAELENFKKRVARERQETIKFATESLIQ
ncbi:MAG: nucleotide exchange factor GrpE, partial [Verrucomicrobiae bacterium]|nr:nucleotide exchange factor GrpE [Verrucomicrobiae bacterium]